MRFSHLTLIPALLISSLCFAFEGSDRLDQDYTRKETDQKPWVLLNESHVSDIAYGQSSSINYFLVRPADFSYIYVKAVCQAAYIRSIQTFLDASPVRVENTAGQVYKVNGYFNRLRISLWQNKIKKGDSCTVSLYGIQEHPVQDVFPNVEDISVLLGEFEAGGPNPSVAEIDTNGAFLKAIYVDVGKCSDLFIAEVGTLTDSSYDLTDPHSSGDLFLVNGGAGLRATKVRVKIVGKNASACKIHVYGSIKDFIHVNLP